MVTTTLVSCLFSRLINHQQKSIMKILILTQYYPPETGAPQNRLSSLATNMKSLGASVEILTAFPNYPSLIKHKSYRYRIKSNIENIEEIK